MEPVSELVRKGQDRAAVARVVHQHVGMDAGHRRRAEGARALVGAHGPVDPVVVEEARDDLAGFLGELAVRVDDDAARLVPRRLDVVRRDRGEAVVVREPVEPEQPSLEAVVALRHVVAARRRFDERLDGLVGGLVREVARRDPGRVAAQPVVDRLVEEDRVEDEGARAETRHERLGDRLRRGAARVAVGVVQPRHGRLERDLVAVERDAERAELLLVEPRPGRDARHALLGDDPLLRLR